MARPNREVLRQLEEEREDRENLGKFLIGAFGKEREGKEFSIDTLADVIGGEAEDSEADDEPPAA